MIVRKWAFARAELIDDDLTSWIAEARARTGVWVIREAPDNHPVFGDAAIVGAMFEFKEEQGSMLLVMTPEQRDALGMTDEVYQEINAKLRADQRSR